MRHRERMMHVVLWSGMVEVTWEHSRDPRENAFNAWFSHIRNAATNAADACPPPLASGWPAARLHQKGTSQATRVACEPSPSRGGSTRKQSSLLHPRAHTAVAAAKASTLADALVATAARPPPTTPTTPAATFTADLDAASMRLALDVVGQAAFGVDFGGVALGACAAVEALPPALAEIQRRMTDPFRRLARDKAGIWGGWVGMLGGVGGKERWLRLGGCLCVLHRHFTRQRPTQPPWLVAGGCGWVVMRVAVGPSPVKELNSTPNMPIPIHLTGVQACRRVRGPLQEGGGGRGGRAAGARYAGGRRPQRRGSLGGLRRPAHRWVTGPKHRILGVTGVCAAWAGAEGWSPWQGQAGLG